MGFSSQAGKVLFKTQTTPGTFDAAFTAGHRAMKLRSGGLGTNRDLLITDPEIGGGRDRVDAYLGAVAWAGDYEFYARLEALTTLLKAGFGSAAAATTTGVTTHTITPLDSATLPLLSIEEQVGGTLEIFHYNDAVVNTLHFEAEANGYLMGTAGVIAKNQVAGATAVAAGSVLWDDTPMIVGTNITVTYNAVSLPAKSFAFDMTNNFEDDDFRLGSFFLGDLVAKGREFSGTLSIRPQDALLWRQASYGGSALTAPGGVTQKNQLVIACTTYEDIVGGTPLTKGSLTFTMPKVALEPYTLEQSGDDIIENDITFQVLRPLAATPACTAVVKAANATVA